MLILRVSIRQLCGIWALPLVASLELLSAHRLVLHQTRGHTQSYVKGLITNELSASANVFVGNAVEDHSASRAKLGGIESLTSKKAVFRDRFGAFMLSQVPLRVLGLLQNCGVFIQAYSLCSGSRGKKRKGKQNKPTKQPNKKTPEVCLCG